MNKPIDKATGHRWALPEGKYYLSARVQGEDFSRVRERVTDLLKEQGFGILTTIDVAQTMKDKLGEDLAPYVILGACNPPLALRGLTHEPGVGALLPCNVVIAQEARGVAVAIVDPEAMFSVVGGSALSDMAQEVKARLSHVISGLKRDAKERELE